jgi:hypothetical protein
MKDLVEKLTVIFQNVNDWLKFAEAKNAVLLAFSGAGITATVTLLAAKDLPDSLEVGLIVATSFLCFCALICSISFLPKTNLEQVLWLRSSPSGRKIPQPTDNLYYFGDLKKYTSFELLDALNNQYFQTRFNPPYEKECEHLANQVVVNAEITFLKFQLFTYALYFLITSIAITPIFILLSLILLRKV